MRLPGGAVWPAMNAATGFFILALTYAAAPSSELPPISPIIMTACGVRVGLEQLQRVDEVHALDRIAADADRGRLAEARAT